MKQLRDLTLDFTKVTDTGLHQLKELKQLQFLTLYRTKVTANPDYSLPRQISNWELLPQRGCRNFARNTVPGEKAPLPPRGGRETFDLSDGYPLETGGTEARKTHRRRYQSR